MSSKQPSVTVLVTVRNSSNTIKKCIDSLLKLDYKNKKIYVTDAYSDDGTFEILKKYGKKIRLERVKGNIAAGHNHMIRRCKSEYIAFTDADCVVQKDWLKKLISAIDSEAVVASGGMVKTPKGVNTLQKLIGRELEYRFSRMPRYVDRLPTISLCVRTRIAKKVLFDEDLAVAQETDWGYRVTKLGRMVFVKDAIVYHYHRATWKNYFKQQYAYARAAFMLFFAKKHKDKMFGDHLTKFYIPFQITLIYSFALFLLMSFVFPELLYVSLLPLGVLLFTYFALADRLSRKGSDFLLYFAIFAFRNIAWCFGIFRGIFVKFK
ncbi:MAG: glycosyltransferase [Candidatus Aenigmarchaeota archaeon]|nr:glycosyltransferase [Candidatus Aenigmarchaeota archaeon]